MFQFAIPAYIILFHSKKNISKFKMNDTRIRIQKKHRAITAALPSFPSEAELAVA